ncbi:MAG TPA: c-type cytochrome biogenesis protein CcsB [Kineosporiaceae bacterium]|nr:c-type cytochrome biogenesis protein CcsB [Kineosporiaceae bacterium]
MAVNETLAQYSNVLVYSSMLVYTGALGAFAVDLSGRGKLVAGQAGLDESEQESSARVAGRVPAMVGVASGPGQAPAAGVTAAGSGSPGTGATGTGENTTGRGTKAGGIAVSLTGLAFLLHLAGVVARGLSVQRAPWGNMYEFAITGSVVVTAMFLLVLARRDIRYLGTFVVGPVLLTLGLAVSVFYTQAAQLVPALHSFWLIIHVSVAFVSSALFTLAFSTTVLQLVQERREKAREAGRVLHRGRFMDALPSSADLERSSYRLHVAAFPLWTFTVIAGAIWAEAAWGKYWNWDPKEVWSFVIWVVYAGYLHARVTRGWDGRRAAYLALAGYACLLFNFLVVNVFFVGMHSYAGV